MYYSQCHKNGLVKTVNFTNPKYVGDPLNAVKIFNEKSVDELIITDIDATFNQSEPNYGLIEKLANESRMPLCYGGGIKNIHDVENIIRGGADKVIINSFGINNPKLLNQAALEFGNQAVIGAIDVKKDNKRAIDFYKKTGAIIDGLDQWKIVRMNKQIIDDYLSR